MILDLIFVAFLPQELPFNEFSINGGAVLGLLQPAPGKRPKTAEQPLLPPPPQATSKVVSKVTEATRNVFFMGCFTCKESG